MPKYKTPTGEIAFVLDSRLLCYMLAGNNRVQTAYGVYNPGKSKYPNIRAHDGIDIDTIDADRRVFSTVSGKVVSSTIVTNKNNLTWQWGNYVCVLDGEGFRHYFCHLASRAVVVGQAVNAGDVLGVMGKTGNAAGDAQTEHVHYEVRKAPYSGSGCVVDPTPWCGMLNKQGEVLADTVTENKGDDIMPASTKAVCMWFGPMSGGDKKRFDAEFRQIGVSYTDESGVLSTAVDISPENQTALMGLAVSVGNIGYGVLATDGGQNSKAAKGLQYIKQAQAALQEAAAALGV